MAFGEQFANAIPSWIFFIIYLLEIFLGFWFAIKARTKLAIVAFVLFAITGLIHILLMAEIIDLLFTHFLERVLLIIVIILVGLAAKRAK